MPKKFSKNDDAEVHRDLKGFNISIDTFGQMKSTLSVDKLNNFLDKSEPENKEDSKEEEE